VVARSRKTDLFSPSYYRCRNPVRNGSSLYPAPRVTSLSLRVLCYLLFKLFVFASFCRKWLCAQPENRPVLTQLLPQPKPSWERILALPHAPRFLPIPWCPLLPSVQIVCLRFLLSEVVVHPAGKQTCSHPATTAAETQLGTDPRSTPLPAFPPYPLVSFVTFCSNCLSLLPSVGSGRRIPHARPAEKSTLFRVSPGTNTKSYSTV
jgi:hypothetical protein